MLSLAVADDKLFSGSYDYTIKVSTVRQRHLNTAQLLLAQETTLVEAENRPKNFPLM